jgi:hypothetical protein
VTVITESLGVLVTAEPVRQARHVPMMVGVRSSAGRR